MSPYSGVCNFTNAEKCQFLGFFLLLVEVKEKLETTPFLSSFMSRMGLELNK